MKPVLDINFLLLFVVSKLIILSDIPKYVHYSTYVHIGAIYIKYIQSMYVTIYIICTATLLRPITYTYIYEYKYILTHIILVIGTYTYTQQYTYTYSLI